MPVTNRDAAQLTPGTTTANSTLNYLNSLPPALATLQAGLALFAIVIIARFVAVQLHVWFRRLRGTSRPGHNRAVTLDNLDHQPSQRPLWAMGEKDSAQVSMGRGGEKVRTYETDTTIGKKLRIDPSWTSTAIHAELPRPLVSRPPPAPPLTPPELSTAVSTLADRPRGSDDSFMHQPNPDYMSSTTTAMTASSTVSPPISRRRSYNKTLPIGVPMPVLQHSSTISDTSELTFSPSSYPPTNPLLPPAPPNAGAKEIDVQGEIIGVLDGDGGGWTRHTRVYGGGVCLACAASGGNHGGGFYGATVRPEEMR